MTGKSGSMFAAVAALAVSAALPIAALAAQQMPNQYNLQPPQTTIAEQIYDQIDLFMGDGCTLRLFQYAHGYYLPPALKLRERMRNLYGKSSRSRIVLKNVPPAYTLTWSTI